MTVPIGVFKSYVHLDNSVDILKKWLDLFPYPLWASEAKKYLEKHCNPWQFTIAQMRNAVFAGYVAQKWNLPFEDIFDWVEEGVKTLPLSVDRLIRLINYMEEIGFDQPKVT